MVLIVTNTTDATADFVVRELQRRSLSFARLNTDEFPQVAIASAKYNNAATIAELRWTNRSHRLLWGDVSAVWYRRPVPPVVDIAITDPGMKTFATNEAYEFLRGLWYSLDCTWVSHPDAIRRAEHKLVQLKAARGCGFSIPDTLASNSPDDIRAFFNASPRRVVAKPLYMGFVETLDGPRFIYTTEVEEAALDHIADTRLAPSLFQELVDKIADIRVTVVGDRVFAARIEAPELPPGVPDWRASAIDKLQYASYSLPADLEDKCRSLVVQLGLRFGAIDLALTPDGHHIFFEINPNGQWAWLELATGQPISAAIVDLLVA